LLRVERGAAILIPLQWHNNCPFQVESASQWHREAMFVFSLTMSSADNTIKFLKFHCRYYLTHSRIIVQNLPS
jgi:hypothetical protein